MCIKVKDARCYQCAVPGRSEFNRAERRIAPLSRELTGFILEQDSLSSHLSSRNETVAQNLEKRNFERAGSVLADVWKTVTIDSRPEIASTSNIIC